MITDTFLTSLACEAIISYATYGTVTWRQNRKMFPQWLVEDLKLKVGYFLNGKRKMGTYLFDISAKPPQYRYRSGNCPMAEQIKNAAELRKNHTLPLPMLKSFEDLMNKFEQEEGKKKKKVFLKPENQKILITASNEIRKVSFW
jgi:hypothetical protein